MFPLPAHMIKNYLERRFQELEILHVSLINNSLEEFHRIGHQISGNAKNFGFPELEPIAAEMENLNIDNLSDKGPKLLDLYREFIEGNLKKFNSL